MTFPFLQENKTFIIAEAGVNHNGDVALARELIDAAVQAKADAVKFQLFDPETLTSTDTPLATYQQREDKHGAIKTQRDLLAQLAFPPEVFADLQAYAQQRGILFLCSPFDEQSALYLHHQLRVPLLKVASGEITNLPFLEMLGEINTPLILSTGMSTLTEVEAAVKSVRKVSQAPLALLHCVSAYPAPVSAVNLTAMKTLQQAFPDCIVGYSDHTLGIHIPLAAVALGARIIEKHFTLDKSLPGPDHKASLSVDELTMMIDNIRDVELSLGSGIKQPQACELDCIQVARKSLVVREDLPAGHCLSESDILAKRPGTGITPGLLHQVIGMRLTKPVVKDALLSFDILEVAQDTRPISIC